jgi:ABC-type polysaccharide/polyol phosphate export permease
MSASIQRAEPAPRIVITPDGVREEIPPGMRLRRMGRELLKAWRLVRIDLRSQSFGLYLGNLWFLLEPLLQAGAYYFLLSVVFRLQGADATFAFFFIGITFWRSHATLVTAGPYFLTGKGYPYVEQGLGLTPALFETIVGELLMLGLRLIVLFGFLIAVGHKPQFAWLLLVPVMAAQFVFSIALFMMLAVAGARFKDIGKLVGHAVWLWWYLSPGLYSLGRIPDWALFIYRANPFAYLMPSYHEIILKGEWSATNIMGCGVIVVVSTAVAVVAARRMFRFAYRLAHYV